MELDSGTPVIELSVSLPQPNVWRVPGVSCRIDMAGLALRCPVVPRGLLHYKAVSVLPFH